MKYFENFKKLNNFDISFDINNNNVKVALVNGLRRICLGEIETPAISESSITIYDNSSYLNNEILSNRLCLVPFKANNIYEDVKFVLDMSNNTDKIKNVYSSDIQIYKDDKKENIEKYIVHTDILLDRLKKEEKINLDGHITYSTLNNGGAYYCPVATVTYSFKKDEKEIKKKLDNIDDPLEKKDFEFLDAYKIYLKNNLDEPSIYQFMMESTGSYSCTDLFEKTLDMLKNKLNIIKTLLDDEKDTKITIEKADYNIESYDFIINDEDDTLGNLLNSYIIEDKKVKFVGYDIPHPLDKKLLIRLALENNNTKENNIKVFKDNIDLVITIIDNMKKEWKTVI